MDAKYDNVRLGMNSRLDTIQAAILLAKFPQFVSYELEQVNGVAFWYNERLRGMGDIRVPDILPGYYSSWAQYTIVLPSIVNRDEVQKKMKEQGIPTMVYY